MVKPKMQLPKIPVKSKKEFKFDIKTGPPISGAVLAVISIALFWNNSGKMPGAVEDRARTLQFFDNNDQFYVRLMYQF